MEEKNPEELLPTGLPFTMNDYVTNILFKSEEILCKKKSPSKDRLFNVVKKIIGWWANIKK